MNVPRSIGLQIYSIAFIFFAMTGCGPAPPLDPVCTQQPTPDQNASLLVEGTTDVYYYVLDNSGQQQTYAKMNSALTLDPGNYTVKVNNTIHDVVIKASHQCHCSTNSILVKGATSDYYYILDSAHVQLSYAHMNEPLSLFPGAYYLKVNNTEQPFTLRLEQPTEITTGTVLARGTTDTYYYVLTTGGDQLHYNKLEQQSPLLEGDYIVKINNTLLPIKVNAGGTTTVNSGTLLVTGMTDEYYYVLDTAGNQLHYAKLNQPASLFPGSYQVKVNNSLLTIVVAESISEAATGSVVVNGNTDAYYYIDLDGNQLAYAKLNQPLALWSGDYSVRFRESQQQVTVNPSKQSIIKW